MKTEFLVTMEYSYSKVPSSEYSGESQTKIDTIGVYSDYNKAIKEANKVLERLEEQFKLNPNYNTKQRLHKKLNLISNVGYIRTPFVFFLKITVLKFGNIDKSIDEILTSIQEYKEYKNKQEY